MPGADDTDVRMSKKMTWQTVLSALAALLCAFSIAASAYASHGLDGDAQRRLLLASNITFLHALSMMLLAYVAVSNLHKWACALMLAGLMLFSGSLVAAALWQTSTRMAPIGGMALMLAWVWVAINFLRAKD